MSAVSRLLQLVAGLSKCSYPEARRILARSVGSLSFSQYAEDLVVDRTLALPAKGFYVDVGAFHPIHQSNTYRFYLKGWQGLTVEPNLEMFRLHRRVRPRDLCVNLGSGGREDVLRYHCFRPGDFNTFDSAMAEDAVRKGAVLLETREIAVRPLSRILDESLQAGQDIHLMSVDCEGLDLEVLNSNDWARWRPWVLLVEDHEQSADPYGATPISDLLRGAGYDLAGRVSYTSVYVLRDRFPSRGAS